MTIILIQIMLNREEDNYGRQKKKYSVIQLNEYVNNNLDLSFFRGFSLSKYLVYSDGSVRIQYLWMREVSNINDTITSTANLPINIDLKKFYSVNIEQFDIPDIWSFDAAYVLKSNTIDIHVRSNRADAISRLIVDIFAFI